MMRRVFSLSLVVILASCAGSPPAIDPADVQSIAVVASDEPPHAEIDQAPKHHSGAAIGAGGGALAGGGYAAASAGALCAIGPLCMLIVIPAAMVGAVVGNAAGNVVDRARSEPDEVATKLGEAVAGLHPTAEIAQRVRQNLGPAAGAQNGSATLEITVTDFRVLTAQDTMAVAIKARSRLYRTSDGATLEERESDRRTEYRPYEEWARDEARPLRAAIDAAYGRVADDVVSARLRSRLRAGSDAPRGG